jgi:hypothetical protein
MATAMTEAVNDYRRDNSPNTPSRKTASWYPVPSILETFTAWN